MELSRGNSLCSYLYFKQAKMSCFSFYFFPFFFYRIQGQDKWSQCEYSYVWVLVIQCSTEKGVALGRKLYKYWTNPMQFPLARIYWPIFLAKVEAQLSYADTCRQSYSIKKLGRSSLLMIFQNYYVLIIQFRLT
jgi:hypothetical protein